MKAVILAGREAARMRLLACNTPKIMVPVLNRPFFEHLIDYLKKHNITDIILAVSKLSEQIEHYFGDGSKFGVSLAYSTEDFPMGTGGAVKNAERFLDDSFIAFNGDIFTDIDLSKWKGEISSGGENDASVFHYKRVKQSQFTPIYLLLHYGLG